MSDTEETEYLSLNSSISHTNRNNKINLIQKKDPIPIKTIEIIADLLNNICEENKDKSNVNNKIAPFMTINIPSMSIKDYLLRLTYYTKINESTIIIIFIYIDRICIINNFKINYRNIYKLIISSMIIAIKYNEDIFYSSEVYAKLGGLSIKELNYLEIKFLILIKFYLFIEQDLFSKYYDTLISFNEENNEETLLESDNNSENNDEDN